MLCFCSRLRVHLALDFLFGYLPLTFENETDYEKIDLGDELALEGIREKIMNGEKVTLKNKTKGMEIPLVSDFSDRQKALLAAGGLLNYTAGKK